MPASDIKSAASSSSYSASSIFAPTNSTDKVDEVFDRPAFRRVIHVFFSGSTATMAGTSSAGAPLRLAEEGGLAGAVSGTAAGGSAGAAAGAASGATGFFLKKLNMDRWWRVLTLGPAAPDTLTGYSTRAHSGPPSLLFD